MEIHQISAACLLVLVCLSGSKADPAPSADPIQGDFDLSRVMGTTWYEIYRSPGSPFQKEHLADITYFWTMVMGDRAVKQEYRAFLPGTGRWYTSTTYAIPGEQFGEMVLVVDNQAYFMNVLFTDYDILMWYMREASVPIERKVAWVVSRNSTISNAQAGHAFDIIQEKLGISPASLIRIEHGIGEKAVNGTAFWSRPAFPLSQGNNWPLPSNAQMMANPNAMQMPLERGNPLFMAPQIGHPMRMPQQMENNWPFAQNQG